MDRAFKAHLIRATYEYCINHSLRPMIVYLSSGSDDPLHSHANDSGLVVLSLAPTAIRNLKIDSEEITFATRFSGSLVQVYMDVNRVVAIQDDKTTCGLQFKPAIDEPPPAPKPSKKKAAVKKGAKPKKPRLRLV